MPLKNLFYKIWKPVVDSITYHYGLNYILAGLFAYIIVMSGFDVLWYQFSLAHPLLYRAGFASALLGFFIPVFVPLGMYIYASATKKKVTQITALALGQAALLGLALSTFI